MTCCMDVMSVFFILLHISSAVPKCIFLDVVIMNGILLIAITSIANVTSPYYSNIASGNLVHVTFTCCMGHLVVFPFTNPRFGPNMSSSLRMSCLVMLQLGIILPLTYLIQSSVLGLPIMSFRA